MCVNLKGLVVLISAWALVSADAPVGQAAEFAKLTVAKADPPKELAEPIGKVLQPTVLRLSEAGKPFYEIWLRKGCPPGQDQDNWLEAERELQRV